MDIQAANCPKCGSVFQRNLRNLCYHCSTAEDNTFTRCADYLWKYPNTGTVHLSEATNTPIELLTQWIKAGKFVKTYKYLDYPCESCRSPIYSGRLCTSCHVQFQGAAQYIESRMPRKVPTVLFSIAHRAKGYSQ